MTHESAATRGEAKKQGERSRLTVDILEGTSRRSRDDILEAAGHHAHVTRRIAGPTATHMRHGRAGGCRKVTGRCVGVCDVSGTLRASLPCAVLAIGKSVLASGKSAKDC